MLAETLSLGLKETEKVGKMKEDLDFLEPIRPKHKTVQLWSQIILQDKRRRIPEAIQRSSGQPLAPQFQHAGARGQGFFHFNIKGWETRWLVELWGWGQPAEPWKLSPWSLVSAQTEKVDLGGVTAEIHSGGNTLLSCWGDTVTPMGMEGRTSSQKGLFLKFRILWSMPIRFWTYLRPVIHFFFPNSPFWNTNINSIPVPPLYFGST